MKRWWKSSKIFLVAGSAAAVVTAAALGISTTPRDATNNPARWTIPDVSRSDLDFAFDQATRWTVQPNEAVQAGILPHHALVSPIIAGWFIGVDDQAAPSTVVIIGPDHYNRGAGYMTTAAVEWQTPDGIVNVNRQLIDILVDNSDVVIDEQLIKTEHGVYTVLPYVKRKWPKAKVVTIAVKGDARPDRLARLAQRLDENLGANDLVLATVDFSHYTTAIDALRADQESLRVLTRGDADAALTIPVDAPPAISFLLTYTKRRSLSYQQLVHTTSAQFTGQLDTQSTTSYVSAYFTERQ